MSQIQIPETIQAATTALNGIDKLLTAKDWERAAIVWAFTCEEGQGTRTDLTCTQLYKLDCRSFAELGIRGLTSHMTVYRYRRIWQDAIDDGTAQPVAPGESVALPATKFSVPERATPFVELKGFENADAEAQVKAIKAVMERKPEVAKRIEDVVVQRASTDHALAGRVFRTYAEHNVTPKETAKPKPLWAEMGFGASIYAQIKGWTKDLDGYLLSLAASRGNPELPSIVQEEIDNLEKAEGLLRQYADKLREAIGVDADAIFNRLVGGER